MSVRLLLLLALVGPFCAFTHASPTELPEDPTAYSTVGVKDEPVFTEAATTEGASAPPASLPPPTDPAATPTEATPTAATPTEAEAAPEVTTVLLTETTTTDATTAATDAPTSGTITPAAAETEEPTDPGETAQTAVVKGAEPDVGVEVVIEREAAEGLGSGQVAGIVIGALLAVVVVVAVVIVVVRRMGKYSSAKNKRRTTKDSVMVSPLRKKTTKQDHPKFWKF